MQRATPAWAVSGDRLVAVDDEARPAAFAARLPRSAVQVTPPWSSTRSGRSGNASCERQLQPAHASRAGGRARPRARTSSRGAARRQRLVELDAEPRAPAGRACRAARGRRIEVRRQRVEHRDDRVEQRLERADEAHPEVALLVDARAARRAGRRGSRRPAASRCGPTRSCDHQRAEARRPANVLVAVVRRSARPSASAQASRWSALTMCCAGGDQLVGLEHDVACRRAWAPARRSPGRSRRCAGSSRTRRRRRRGRRRTARPG